MALADVKDSWVTYYEKLTQAAEEAGAQDAVQWILKTAPWTYNRLRRRLFASLKIGAGTSLLQAGSGVGKSGIAEALLAGCEVTLLDYSARALHCAASVLQQLQARYPQIAPRVQFLHGALEDLQVENRFDVTFNEGVVEHWFTDHERLQILLQMKRWTKPGGKVIVFVPNDKNPFYRRAIARGIARHSPVPPEKGFTSEELCQRMEEAGLADVMVQGFAPHLTFGGYTRFRPLAFLAWLLEPLLPKSIAHVYRDRYGFFLVGIGTRRLDQ